MKSLQPVRKHLRAHSALLLVVDVQGNLAQRAVGSEQMHKRLPVLIRGCHLLGVPVVYTEQLPDKLGQTSPVVKEALVAAGAKRLVKSTFSCLGLREMREEIEEQNSDCVVLLCGIEAHICVAQTCQDLLDTNGCGVHVITDCTSSQRQAELDLGLRRMEVLPLVWCSSLSQLLRLRSDRERC